jgi:hypothetical protein
MQNGVECHIQSKPLIVIWSLVDGTSNALTGHESAGLGQKCVEHGQDVIFCATGYHHPGKWDGGFANQGNNILGKTRH